MNEIELTEEEQKELIAEFANDTLINESVEDTKTYTFEEMEEIDKF